MNKKLIAITTLVAALSSMTFMSASYSDDTANNMPMTQDQGAQSMSGNTDTSGAQGMSGSMETSGAQGMSGSMETSGAQGMSGSMETSGNQPMSSSTGQ